jgi:vancomycin resistance protein YoaR
VDDYPLQAGRAARPGALPISHEGRRASRPAAALFGLALALAGAAGLTLRAASPPPGVSLSSYRTSLAGRTPNQAANIRLAAQRVDGVTLHPGEVFSFARAVGPVSAETGFVKGLALRGGEPAREDGGGICQVASTVYNAALRANLRIVERRKHLWPVQSVPPGLDATFASGHVDLRFENTLKQTIRLRLAADDRHLTARIIGERREPATVEVVRAVRSTLPPERIVRASSLLRRGQQRIVNHGRPGFEVEVWREVHQEGQTCRERLSSDRYAPVNQIVEIGTRR